MASIYQIDLVRRVLFLSSQRDSTLAYSPSYVGTRAKPNGSGHATVLTDCLGSWEEGKKVDPTL